MKKTNRSVVFSFFCFSLIVTLSFCLAVAENPGPAGDAYGAGGVNLVNINPGSSLIVSAEALMQQGEYKKAYETLIKGKIAEAERDYSGYLMALALYRSGDLERSLAICLDIRQNSPQSLWIHKVNFLAADIYREKKDFTKAEALYETEAQRLLSEIRKEQIAGIYTGFAEILAYKPRPEEVDRPRPDFKMAYQFYARALELEIGSDLRDNILFKMAVIQEDLKNKNEAIKAYRTYLGLYDPQWFGIGSGGQAREIGLHRAQARYNLAELYLAGGKLTAARLEFENLLVFLKNLKAAPAALQSGDLGSAGEIEKWQRWAMRRLPATRSFPRPSTDADLEAGIKSTNEYLAQYPNDNLAVYLAFQMIGAYSSRGLSDAAIKAADEFGKGRGFKVPAEETPEEIELRRKIGIDKSPLQMFDEYQKLAVYITGSIYYAQKKYQKAIENFTAYTVQFPNGPNWTDAQKGILDAEYQIGIDYLLQKDYSKVREVWDAFLAKHPLDGRSRRIAFTFGQMEYELAKELKQAGKAASAAFKEAILGFKRVVSKYPKTEESSLAQLRIGEIYENELSDFVPALEAYRFLTWGSYRYQAAARITAMTGKELTVKTLRTYRTNEKPLVTVNTRNVENLRIKIYRLDAREYFLKFHTIEGVESLDLALIQPDKVWDVKTAGYKNYLPLEQNIEIPMEGPGVYAVNVSEDKFEATTLVVRSDIDIIVKSSKNEVLVFAEDRLKNTPAAGTEITLTDGGKVIYSGITGKDGVLLQKLDDIKSAANLCVFAGKNGHIASNRLDLYGLEFSKGLAPKTYIYTDKPVYKPGEVVNFQAVLRAVKDGSYVSEPGKAVFCSVLDPNSRIIYESKLTQSEFGTISVQLTLSASATIGNYSIRFSDESKRPLGASGFLVETYKLEKIKMDISFDKPFYFRNETVKAKIKAAYYYGQGVSAREIRVYLPDGRELSAATDVNGEYALSFDTAVYAEEAVLSFSAALVSENVSVSADVRLVKYGFNAVVSTAKNLTLVGEPVALTVRATDPEGRGAARDLELGIYRVESKYTDPIFFQVPWLSEEYSVVQGVTEVNNIKLKTDEHGFARTSFVPEVGGVYLYRLRGQDRFGNIVTASAKSTVSGSDDTVKLRLLTETQHYRVGEKSEISIHSRLEKKQLALLTVEGEGIIDYEIREIQPGMNKVSFIVANKHYPNFSYNLALINQTSLETASLPLTVERELLVTVSASDPSYEPGKTARLSIKVTDQLLNPVQAQLTLALVNAALYASYPDTSENIVRFFEEGAVRSAQMRIGTSGTFAYFPQTIEVNQDIVAEEGRRVKEADKKAMKSEAASSRSDRSGFSAPEDEAPLASAAVEETEAQPQAKPQPESRKESDTQSYWTVFVVTSKDGSAELEVPLPQTISSYRLTCKGVTRETLVGETWGSLTVKKDFFADLKVPAVLQEKDKIKVPFSLHNATAIAGKATCVLTIKTAEGRETRLEQTLTLKAQEIQEVLAGEYEVPSTGALTMTLSVTVGKGELADIVEKTVPVKPWGLFFSASRSGKGQSDSSVYLSLPRGKDYSSIFMQIDISRSVDQALIDRVLKGNSVARYAETYGSAYFPGSPGSKLLATSSALDYMKAAGYRTGEIKELEAAARGLIAELIATQNSTGSWDAGTNQLALTSLNYWALIEARKSGIAVDTSILARAELYLKNQYTALDQEKYGLRAMILHALSEDSKADFSFVNRLYRERNSLSNAELAYTVLCLAALDRKEMGAELLGLLDSRSLAYKEEPVTFPDEYKGIYWPGKDNIVWEQNDAETTALVLLAYNSISPQSEQARGAANYLMNTLGSLRYLPDKTRNIILSALLKYSRGLEITRTDYVLEITVNGTVLQTLTVNKDNPGFTLTVPHDLLKPADNKVDFHLQGRGEFVYLVSLDGFSTDLKTPPAWKEPLIKSKTYYHENLKYKGTAVGESSMVIDELEFNSVATVELSIESYARDKYLVLVDYIPSGCVILADSVQTGTSRYKIEDNKIMFYFKPDDYLGKVSYQIAGYVPGSYAVLPPVLKNLFAQDEMVIGKTAELTLLASGEKSTAQYKMNTSELYGLGKAYFEDNLNREALELLEKLYGLDRKYNKKDVARMLFWLRSTEEFYNAPHLVEYFEVLKENYPDLYLPFDKIMAIGRAYHDLGEFERAYLVYRATVLGSYTKDAAVGGALSGAGEVIGSINYMIGLWMEYPDASRVLNAFFALTQQLYATDAAKISNRFALSAKKKSSLSRDDILVSSEQMLWKFLALYLIDPLADDAAFSLVNIKLDRKEYEQAAALCRTFRVVFPKSEYITSFQYMEALSYFSMRKYTEAVKTAELLAGSDNEFNALANYILGQIYHAQNKPELALKYYKQVQDIFPDAKEAVAFFEKKQISLPEAVSFKPGEKTDITVKYRNIKKAFFQVYQVDLMKLYLKEKNLSRITSINLSGISPQIEKELTLGEGKDYADKEKTVSFNLKAPGAYLVICRGDDLFASGLVLITPLQIEVQEDAVSGRVRVNVKDTRSGLYADNVHVKVIGSENTGFISGETDLRGIFIADGIQGIATVIVRDKDNNYAFYRGTVWLGESTYYESSEFTEPGAGTDYREDLQNKQELMLQQNQLNLDQLYQDETSGVQVQEAY